MKLPKCWMRGHPLPFRVEERWIEVNGPGSEGKRNKPAERLYEVKKICTECGVTANTAYLTPEQLDAYDKGRENAGATTPI